MSSVDIFILISREIGKQIINTVKYSILRIFLIFNCCKFALKNFCCVPFKAMTIEILVLPKGNKNGKFKSKLVSHLDVLLIRKSFVDLTNFQS